MFVVVLIKCAKEYVVVPEEWIYGVNLESLLNNGVNSNRDMLIFWSTNIRNVPNFMLEKSLEFPPTNDQACYLVRVIRYYGKLSFNSLKNSIGQNTVEVRKS